MRLIVIATSLVALTVSSLSLASTGGDEKRVALLRYQKRVAERDAWKGEFWRVREERDQSRLWLGQQVRAARSLIRANHFELLAAQRMITSLQKPVRRDVLYAIRLASATFGVPYQDMLRIAQCESQLNPYAKNRTSTASGLYQWLSSSWAAQGIAGFSVWDPVANALAAARARVRDGSWRQWVCSA